MFVDAAYNRLRAAKIQLNYAGVFMNKTSLGSLIPLVPALMLVTGCTHFSILGDAPEKSFAEKSAVATTDPLASTDNEWPNHSLQVSQNNMECTPNSGSQWQQGYFYDSNGAKKNTIQVRATGYGAPPKAFYPEPQRRLMAMRAAKIDAYRSLAERVNGVHIWGGTTIGDMVVEKDRFRVFLDTHISGARILSENPSEDGTYETVVEVKIGQYFLDGAIGDQPLQARHNNNPCPENSPMLTREFRQISLSDDTNSTGGMTRPRIGSGIASPTGSAQFYFKKE